MDKLLESLSKLLDVMGKAAAAMWLSAQPWAQRNVTFGLILAIVTEVPRWTFAFAAAHEPIWAGCALAALMSYAAAHAWEEYFREHDWLLLILNSLSLAFGVFTISPVIFAMTNGGGHSVNMKDVLSGFWLWAWSVVLASTTFLPLIQVAVVEVRRRQREQVMQTAAQSSRPKVKSTQPVEATAATQLDPPPLADNAQLDPQPVAIAEDLQTQLDEMDTKILAALRNGAYTPYAISKATGIGITTLKRTDKATGKVSGRLPKLVAANMIHNSSGVDGSEYRLAGE